MFTKNITKTVDMIGEFGEEKGKVIGQVTVRKLSARSLAKAREARQIAAAQLTAKMGPEMLTAFKDASKDRGDAPMVPAEENPDARYQAYDRDHVLIAGVTSWTFKDEDAKDIPISEGLDDLDEPSAEFLYREIVDLSDPAPDVNEADQKKVQGVTPTS